MLPTHRYPHTVLGFLGAVLSLVFVDLKLHSLVYECFKIKKERKKKGGGKKKKERKKPKKRRKKKRVGRAE